MGASPPSLSGHKRPQSLKLAMACDSYLLSGLTLTLVLLLTGEVHQVLANGDRSNLRAKFSELLGGNSPQMYERNKNADSASHKVSSRKVEPVLKTTTSSKTIRQLTDEPVNLVNGVSQSGEDMCLSLTGGNSEPIDLQVCDDSDEQKWLFGPDSASSGPIQSYFNKNLCLDGGDGGNGQTALFSSTCNYSFSSQKWSQDSDGTLDNLNGNFLTVGNSCEEVQHGDANIFMHNDLAVSHFFERNWTQIGSDLDGEAAWDESGRSVSISSDGMTVAVGAHKNDVDKIFSVGHVRVYRFNQETSRWTQLGIDVDGEASSDLSGHSVSLSSDGLTMAVGAYGNDGSNGLDSGHVRVYKYYESTSKWTQVGPDIDGERSGDRSGWSVSLSSDGYILAVGAQMNDDNGENSGHIRVFNYSQAISNWTQLGSDLDGEYEYDLSGISVSLSSDGYTVAVGAINNDNLGGNDSGHVRVYKYNQSNLDWEQLGIDLDGEDDNDTSGRSVSISSDGLTVAVGAYGNDDNGNDAGHVRVYNYNPTTSRWKKLGFDINGESGGDNSGVSVSLSSDGYTLAVGAWKNDNGSGIDAGHVRIFNYNQTTSEWIQFGSDIDGESGGDNSGVSISISSDGSIVAVGAHMNDNVSGNDAGHVRVFTAPTSCTDHQKWNIRTISAPTGMLDVNIERTGNVTVSEGYGPLQKLLVFDHSVSTNGGTTIANATVFEKDCITPVNATILPVSSSTRDDSLLRVVVTYDFLTTETDPKIYKGKTNDAGVEFGGIARFCLRVDMYHVATNWGLNFLETNVTVLVDKTQGFNLTVDVDRDDASEETLDEVDFDASVVGFKCDVSSFAPNNDSVSQGSTLGLCVRSNTTGIKIAGWDSLVISRPGARFNGITSGVHIPNLVVPSCVDGQCTSQVQLVSMFFDSDGELSVNGVVILAVNETRRHLGEIKRDDVLSADESFGRVLEEDINHGEFKIGINVASSVSASTTLYPGSFYPLMVAFMVLKFLVC